MRRPGVVSLLGRQAQSRRPHLVRSSAEPIMSVAVEVPVVLVVDDDLVIRALSEALLTRCGFGVALAVDGAQAVEVYRALPGMFSLVLLDLYMPGMDGPATLEALRQIDPGVRCCFMSGSPDDLARTRSLPGVTGFVEKPFQADRLGLTLRQAMKG
jgi:CheY-like chemotaxis protein